MTRELRERVLSMMAARGWSTEWIHRSAYLHLEAAELAEAVRGKRGDPLDEAGDVLITLLALARHGLPEIIAAAERKLELLEAGARYKGEHVDAQWEIRAVLAGARRGMAMLNPQCSRTHWAKNGVPACRRVKAESLADREATDQRAAPTCAECLRVWQRINAGACA